MRHSLWQEVHDRKIAAAIGTLPDPPADARLIRVSCEVAPAALRPLLEARRLTEAIVGEARGGRARPRGRTLFGDTPERATEAVVVDLWNRLARQGDARWVVVFDAVEQADAATLAALTRIVGRAEWLLLPLLLVFRAEPEGPAAELLAAVRARDGEAVVRGEAAPVEVTPAVAWRDLPPEVLRVLRAGALIGPGFEVRLVAELLAVEPEHVLEQLQHARDVGVPVEDRGEGRFSLPGAALSALAATILPSLAQAWHRKLGRLLGARAARESAPPPPPPPPPMTWLENFRAGRGGDARVAEIIDLSEEAVDLLAEPGADGDTSAGAGGEGRDVPGDIRQRAASGPQAVPEDSEYRAAGGPQAVPEDSVPRAVGGPRAVPEDSQSRAASGPQDVPEDRRYRAASGPQAVPKDSPSPRRPVQRRTVVAPPAEGARTGRRRTLVLSPEVDLPAPVDLPAGAPAAASTLEDPLVDDVRAAEHMRAAGDLEAAAEHLCAAARKAGQMGAPQAAVQHASSALDLLVALPTGPVRRRLRARALLELGRVQWQAPGYEQGFTLTQARETLAAARAELDPEAPVELAVEVAEALAGVHFDLGDGPSLTRALAELEEASRLLHAAGDPIGAACLFNDQAAVRVRMGDGGHALRLVRASRAIFDARAAEDPAALRELAESEHLLARLPLHARLRLGREDEGYAIGLEHALAAERLFQALDDARELARVWETIGRLELKRLRIEEARQRLEAAFAAQTQLGDLTGLAQTTEFLAEVLGWCGRNAEAIARLRESVIYSRDKGSPRGLMSNREAFTNLSSRFAGLSEHAEALREVEILLAAGERELGLSTGA